MKAQKLWRSSLLIAALLPAGIVAACSAKLGEPGVGQGMIANGGNANSGGGSSGGTGSGSPGVMPGSAATGPATAVSVPTSQPVAESAGQLMMRRLTFSEYDHVLADLLGDTTAPAEDPSHQWSPDGLNTDGFTTPNSAPDLLIQNINTTSDTVVETALAAGKLGIPCTNPATPAAETACVTTFITNFGLRAYRRPVAAAEQTDLMTLFTTVRGLGASFTESVASVAKGMIQSPNFLYHWEIGPTKPVAGADGLVPLTQWQIASRLAESLWDTMPDATLLTAVQAGQLGTAAQVLAQAQRMIADPRAVQALSDFHAQWLIAVGSHPGTFGGITPSGLLTSAAIAGLPTEFSSFVSSIYSTGDGTLTSFLTAPYAYVNHDLAAIYGVPGPSATAGFTKITLDPSQRGGLFTQVAFLASFGAGVTDNPIFRGLSVYTKLLCGTTNPPPMVVPGVNFVPGGTTRQSYEKHASNLCAAGCHTVFDPPGFAFENYDGIGTYRTTDTGQPVDSTGTFQSPAGNTFTFTNALDLMKQLAASSETQLCVDRQWTRYILGRMETSAEVGSLQLAYEKGKATTDFSLRDMLTAFVSSKSFMYRQPSAGEML
jgi:hypothetical protein